jgi:hypothetical protein
MKTTAIAVLTVEIHDLGAWGPSITMGQVANQAEEAARERLDKLGKSGIRVLDVAVKTVTTE